MPITASPLPYIKPSKILAEIPGLKGHLSTRLQPNHPTDDVLGISASILDGLMYGNGDAVIGINQSCCETG
jgi:ethanolamine ammonia-lyase large subunit